MVRLRSNGEKFLFEIWLIYGEVQRVEQLEIDDTLISRLRKYGI
jgi:hypothetical protein